MSEYINADARNNTSTSRTIPSSYKPTADVVEVVRCKECIYRGTDKCPSRLNDADFYCCQGKKREDEQTSNNNDMDIKDLTVDGISAFENERVQVITIYWSANIGFGEYTLTAKNCKDWKGDSECMDKGDDKEFLKMLLEKVVEMVEVTG